MSENTRRAQKIFDDLATGFACIQVTAGINMSKAVRLLNDLALIVTAMEGEIASRGRYISDMNAIVGYDNSDGRSCEPGPHDIAKRYVEAAVKLARFAADTSDRPKHVVEGQRQLALQAYRGIHVPPGVPV